MAISKSFQQSAFRGLKAAVVYLIFLLLCCGVDAWVSLGKHRTWLRTTLYWGPQRPLALISPRPLRKDDDDDGNNESEASVFFSKLPVLLREHGFGSRIRSLPWPLILQENNNNNNNNTSDCIWAEVVVNATTRLAQIVSSIPPTTATAKTTTMEHHDFLPPKFLVEYSIPSQQSSTTTSHLVNSSIQTIQAVIDFGQLTTIWENEVVSDPTGKIVLNKDDAEQAMDRLYQSRVGRARTVKDTTLTKKRIAQLVQGYTDCNNDNDSTQLEPQQQHMETVLRQVCKTGTGFARLVDSGHLAVDGVFQKISKILLQPEYHSVRAHAARLLSEDAVTGGRFKRWPCQFLRYDRRNGEILFLNGGWIVTDLSVRAGTEARKFSSRGDGRLGEGTMADARIARRLECLAMGDLLMDRPSNDTRRDLELVVRETLSAMDLPFSPDGAKLALVQTGYWSGKSVEKLNRLAQTTMFQPWSPSILDAAQWYALHVADRNRKGCTFDQRYSSGNALVDLRLLPCVSIDAQTATFRDDAIGVRTRVSTGRRILPDASKWEILVHIADSSDIYSPSSDLATDMVAKLHLSRLRSAAESRGTSRYDLPRGPLHLLPPIVLSALAFTNNGADSTNGCPSLTVWAYIDEQNGQLLDCGVERTIISPPIKLSFTTATTIMDDDSEQVAIKARVMLLVMERILQKWNDDHLKHNAAAQNREIRLRTRATSSTSNSRHDKAGRDDGTDGFQRSRGHRLVDIALDLYSIVSSKLLRRMNAPVPKSIGADASRGGRFATAPLRRYIDGQSQRQILAVLCNYGNPMSLAECQQASTIANESTNSIANVRSLRAK